MQSDRLSTYQARDEEENVHTIYVYRRLIDPVLLSVTVPQWAGQDLIHRMAANGNEVLIDNGGWLIELPTGRRMRRF